jgi:hypothetical protein
MTDRREQPLATGEPAAWQPRTAPATHVPTSAALACTVITPDHLPWALTLARSLHRHGTLELAVLVVDGLRKLDLSAARRVLGGRPPYIQLYGLADLWHEKPVRATALRHANSADRLRWSLKSAFSLHLLAQAEKVLFLDCDVHFYGDYQFILDRLEQTAILLTPHWRRIWPPAAGPSGELLAQFTDGLFNAGFVGTRRGAEEFLRWWNTVCNWRCDNAPAEGLYADQRYLDLVPVVFADRAAVLEHRGCNVAIWNRVENRRETIGGEVRINGRWPIVFIHVTKYLLQVCERFDPALAPYVAQFRRELSQATKYITQTRAGIL